MEGREEYLQTRFPSLFITSCQMTLETLETSVVLVSALNDFNYYYQAKEEKGTNED